MTTQQAIDLKAFLNQQRLCESLTVSEIQTLLDYTELAEYNGKQVIAEIGEVNHALYFGIEGETVLSYEEAGSEIEVGRFKPGELMGEMSFFDGTPRLLRLRVDREGARVLKLSRRKYERLKAEYPYIAVNILEHALISQDHLLRRISADEISLSYYMFGRSKH